MKAEDVRDRRGEPVIVIYEDGTERPGTIEWGDGVRFAWSVYFEVGGRDHFYDHGPAVYPRLRPDPGGARPVWASFDEKTTDWSKCPHCGAPVRVGALCPCDSWEDRKDEWSAAIDAAHPTRSGSHDEYGVAMRMVGNRHSKGALVSLVNWLLVRLRERGEG